MSNKVLDCMIPIIVPQLIQIDVMAARGCSLKERRTSGAGVTFVIDGGTGHVLGGNEGPIPEYTGPAPAASNERTNSSFINNLPTSLFGCLCFCFS